MNIKHITHLLLFVTSISFGMNKNLSQYIGENPNQHIRNQLQKANHKADINQIVLLGAGNITAQEIISFNERYGVCQNYTFSKYMKIIGKVPQILKNTNGTACSYYSKYQINILEHFYPVEQPQAGDLAIYGYKKSITTDNDDATNYDNIESEYRTIQYVFNHLSSIKHTGEVTYNGNIESKWENTRAIFNHSLWCIPENYGDHVLFFRLNKTGSKLLSAVQRKLKDLESPTINNIIISYTHQENFLDLAKHNNSTNSCNKNYFALIIDDLLQSYMDIDPDKPDKDGKTALILAACVGDKNSVDLLLKYNVNIDSQDKEGNTALIHSAMNGYHTIKQQLIQNGANIKIKNNNDFTADDYSIQFIETCIKKRNFLISIFAIGMMYHSQSKF